MLKKSIVEGGVIIIKSIRHKYEKNNSQFWSNCFKRKKNILYNLNRIKLLVNSLVLKIVKKCIREEKIKKKLFEWKEKHKLFDKFLKIKNILLVNLSTTVGFYSAAALF